MKFEVIFGYIVSSRLAWWDPVWSKMKNKKKERKREEKLNNIAFSKKEQLQLDTQTVPLGLVIRSFISRALFSAFLSAQPESCCLTPGKPTYWPGLYTFPCVSDFLLLRDMQGEGSQISLHLPLSLAALRLLLPGAGSWSMVRWLAHPPSFHVH